MSSDRLLDDDDVFKGRFSAAQKNSGLAGEGNLRDPSLNIITLT